MLSNRRHAGVSLIELLIGLVIVGVLLTMAVPWFGTFLQNAQIRNGAGSVLSGLQLARAEAIRRNALVRFQFVSDLGMTCALSTSSLAWVVSQSDPTGACNAPPSDTTPPRIIQSRSASEGTANVTAAVTVTSQSGQFAGQNVDDSTVVFTGLGRRLPGGIAQIDFANRTGTCEHVDALNGKMRCLRIVLSDAGQMKLCDPKVADSTDPRFCN